MGRNHILCVDDQTTNLIVLEALLEQDFECHGVTSGPEALKWLLTHPVDLILLDIMMPEMDGFEVARLVRSNPVTRHIPIIFVSAKDGETTIEEAFKNGGNDYISKPIRGGELLARMNLQLALLVKDREVKDKQRLIELILEKQENLVLMVAGNKIQYANTAFLLFSGFQTLQEFRESYSDISRWFVEHTPDYSLSEDLQMIFSRPFTIEKTSESYIIELHTQSSSSAVSFKVDVVCLDKGNECIVTLTDVTELQHEKKSLHFQAIHDQLTGLLNRAAFDQQIEHYLQVAKRYESIFSIILFDIDNFKLVNDTYGHLIGDEVLKKITEVLKKVRKSDIAARWGGEEFMVILPKTSQEEASVVAEGLRLMISQINLKGIIVTCSFGITEYKDFDTLETLISRADKALYEAKSTGKNKVCFR